MIDLERLRLLLVLDREREALELLTHALAEDPEDTVALCLRSACLSQLGEHRDAIQDAERAVGLAPDDPECQGARARALFHADLDATAVRACEEWLALDPASLDGWVLLASSQAACGRWKESLAAADRALELDPTDANALNVRANALIHLGRGEEARRGLDLVLALDPDSAWSHANLGQAALHAGQVEDAVRHFQEALRIDPDLDGARLGLVEALKGRNPLYRVLLTWSLFLARQSRGRGTLIVIGLFVLMRVLRRASQALGDWTGYESTGLVLAVGVFGLYLGFMYFTWLGPALFDSLMLADRKLRPLLDRDQRANAWTAMACWIAGLALAALNLLRVDLLHGLAALASCFIVAVPLTATRALTRPALRRVGWAISITLALCAVVGASTLLPGPTGDELPLSLILMLVAWGGSMLSTWLFAFA